MTTPLETIRKALYRYERALIEAESMHGFYQSAKGAWCCGECRAKAKYVKDIPHKPNCVQGQALLDVQRARAHFGIEEE